MPYTRADVHIRKNDRITAYVQQTPGVGSSIVLRITTNDNGGLSLYILDAKTARDVAAKLVATADALEKE